MLALVGSGEYLPPIASVDRELIRRLAAPVRGQHRPDPNRREI